MSLTITPYTDEVRDEVLSLWAEALPLDAITEGVLENRVLLDENFSPETFLLARSQGRLTGFVLGVCARGMPLGDADPKGDRGWITALGVAPGEDLPAVGGRLLEEVEARFRAAGKRECYVSGYPPGYFTPGIDQRHYAKLVELFQDRGYRKYHEALSMDAAIILFTVPEQVRETQRALAGQGIQFRPYRRTDLLRFLAFLERTMPSDWVRVERRNLRKISEGGFQPGQVFLALSGDEVVGYCQFEGAHFGPFGVSDAHQGKGIGTVLLARTLERMRQEEHHNAWVMWTDDTAAKVYGKFGFTETRRFAMLNKNL